MGHRAPEWKIPRLPCVARTSGGRASGRAADRIVMNRTPNRLRITGRNGATLTLAPFERLKIPASKLRPFALAPLVDAGVIENMPSKQLGSAARPVLLVLGGLCVLLVGSLLMGSALLSGLVLLVAVMAAGWLLPRHPARELASCLSDLLVRLGRLSIETVLRMKDHFSLLLVLLIAVVLPGLAIANTVRIEVANGADDVLRLVVGYGFPWLFVTTLSIMPVALYFLFDREQLGALSGRFVRHVFRLDPSIATMRDLEAKYGRQMVEVFGAWNLTRRTNRVPQGRRSPLWLATLLVTVGWVSALLNAKSPADSDLLGLLIPTKSAMAFGFLGAYFFSIQAVLRGYLRRDLRPRTYSSISVRFLIVTILAWVLEASAPHNEFLWVLAFFTGVFPDTGVRYLREFLMSRDSVRQFVPSLYERAPLTDLEGIDVYDRSRLEDEGVTNVEALAHSDLVDLVLHTRIPAARLVDWVDQAILYLHLGLYDEVEPEGPAHQLRDRLRRHGIRTATDLLHAYEVARERGEGDPGQLWQSLASSADAAGAGAPGMQVIVDGLAEEEWLENIRHWRECSRFRERTREEHCPAPDEAVAADGALITPAQEVVLVKTAATVSPGAAAAAH
jgi:hypothetical protein